MGSDNPTPKKEVASALAVSVAPIPGRETIARIVEQVFAARGISRGGTPRPYNPASSPAPLDAAAAVAPAAAPVPAPTKTEVPLHQTLASTASAAAPPIEVAEFVCENDVRSALAHNQKIFVGPKTIVTPSARDFGNAHEAFVVTDMVSTASRKPRN